MSIYIVKGSEIKCLKMFKSKHLKGRSGPRVGHFFPLQRLGPCVGHFFFRNVRNPCWTAFSVILVMTKTKPFFLWEVFPNLNCVIWLYLI